MLGFFDELDRCIIQVQVVGCLDVVDTKLVSAGANDKQLRFFWTQSYIELFAVIRSQIKEVLKGVDIIGREESVVSVANC